VKLHEDREFFSTSVSSAAQSMNLPDVYIEKDYWITRSLNQLSKSEISEEIVFKGGTSLSKAHKLIHRFSEDIDLAAIAHGMGDAKRKRLLKNVDLTAGEGLELLPDDERSSKGSKFRKSVYRYPRFTDEGSFGQASPDLLVEVNTFTRPEPCERKIIQSMIADMFVQEGRQDLVDKYELDSFELNVLTVRRTLVEKLLGIISDSYNEDPVTRINIRIRHIYDVCMILSAQEHRDFVSGNEFIVLCQQCIDDEIESWGERKKSHLKEPLHKAPLFSMFDNWWPGIESTYNNSFANLVYRELPEAQNIKETLRFLHQELTKQ
jgi:Nucleotidyl transferase AbiEii toxin, Type IV TA system